MIKKVQILNSIGKIVVEYSIHARSLNSPVTDMDYFNLAWANAIEDRLVNPEHWKNYKFIFVD